MNFTKYQLSNIHYGGSEEKLGIVIDNINYILKFQKETENGISNNHICEYIGSSIFALCGESVQKTLLGTYNGRNVVACIDFNTKNNEFVPFNDVGDSSLENDHEVYQYTYEDIIRMLEENKKITNVQETIEKFWDLYIYDALLGNFDRHGSNWGFIKETGRYKMAPIFDNGSCLFPRIVTDNQCKMIMNVKSELEARTFRFPTSQIKHGRSKSSYFEVISSLTFKECNQALLRVYPRINIEKINKFIRSIDLLSEIQKDFYCTIIQFRYENIIKFSYRKLRRDFHE